MEEIRKKLIPCCVTGHRELPPEKIDYITKQLKKQIKEALEDGYTLFISGFAQGVDIIFAELVIEFKKKNPNIYLEAALPYCTWMNRRSEEDKALLAQCDFVKPGLDKYQPSCYFARNRYMVLESDRVIAVYDGREKGGTFQTIRYTRAMEKELRTIEI